MHCVLKVAESTKEFQDGLFLFQQYAESIEIDLSFQNFTNELQTIDKQYNKPDGVLILAYVDGNPVGCAGVRKLDPQTAELKRMFVKKGFRGIKIGEKLLELSITLADQLKYETMRLDTLPSMDQAQNLYRKFGFYEIPPYCYNPFEGAIFMEKKL